MDVEILTIGNELLLGFTTDTNAAHLSRELAATGVRVSRRATVGDDPAQIRAAVDEALRRTGFVITTGGLGPTRDDMTKKVVADLFGMPLDLDETYLAALRKRFEAFGRGPMPASNRSQAEIPRGAVVLENRWGTAPGLWLEGKPGVAVLLPGVPHEMKNLLQHEVLTRLREKTGGGAGSAIRSLTIRTAGIGESALAELIEGAEERIAPVTLAYLPGVEGVDLRLTAWNADGDAGQGLAAAAEALRHAIGAFCYGDDETDMAEVVVSQLKRRGYQLAVAESCTGGLLGGRITAIPGSSSVFVGGIISYADRVKTVELGVNESLLMTHGAVSEHVVRDMVQGVTRKFGVEAGIAVTGVAGPHGGTPEKPVGTVWLAASLNGKVSVSRRLFVGGRQEIRQRSTQIGLDLLRRLLSEE